jgi:hypothetical protein
MAVSTLLAQNVMEHLRHSHHSVTASFYHRLICNHIDTLPAPLTITMIKCVSCMTITMIKCVSCMIPYWFC